MRAGNPTWLIGYDKIPIGGPKAHRLTVEVGPVELGDGHLDILIADAQAGNAENASRLTAFGVRDLTQLGVASAEEKPLFDRAALMTAQGSVDADLSKAHTLTLSWTDTNFSFAIDGVESAQRAWPEGFLSAWQGQLGKVVIAFTGRAAPIARVVLEEGMLADAPFSRAMSPVVACQDDGGNGGDGGAGAGDAGAGGDAGHAATGGTAADAGTASAPITGSCGCRLGTTSEVPVRFGLTGFLLFVLAARRRLRRSH